MLVDLQQNTLTTVSPYVMVFNTMLQMTSLEFETYLSQQIEENPLLEYEWQDNNSEGFNDYKQSSNLSGRAIEWDSKYGSVDIFGNKKNLYDHLLIQLEQSSLTESEKNTALEIISCLDGDGRFVDSLDEIAKSLDIPYEDAEEILFFVQALEPAGVAARSFEECLLLQLKRYDTDTICEKIIADHLADLAKNHFNQIAKTLRISDKRVRAAYQKIRSLDPRPCSEFTSAFVPHYLYPDLKVSLTRDSYTLSIRKGNTFSIRINEDYLSLLEKETNTSTQKYVAEQHTKAKNLIRCIHQRDETITQIGKLIVEWQAPFLLGGKSTLKPMSLADIAKQANTHESTVSRAIRGKYLLSPRGTHALNSFFERRATTTQDGDAFSPNQIKAKITMYIEKEPSFKPLSDQRIVNLLKKENINIARRTVAKYRDSLGIPPATARKKIS